VSLIDTGFETDRYGPWLRRGKYAAEAAAEEGRVSPGSRLAQVLAAVPAAWLAASLGARHVAPEGLHRLDRPRHGWLSMDQRTSSGAQEPQPLPHCNPALQQEGTYLVDLLIRFNNRPQHKGTASSLIQ
jgi:hypothetical protein